MARGKKRETLTPEERLQAALVPESEQPYKVPENWCWVRLLDSFYNCTDSKKKIPQKEYIHSGELAVVDQGQDLVGGYTNDSEIAFSGNLPVIIFGDHTRCIKYIDFPFAQGADGVKVLKPKRCFDVKAFYYAFQNVNIPNMGYRRHFPLFNQYAIPLPPLPEQHRIVDRIESLFAKLDEAKQKAQDALDSFETRKAAILHKAFTGELTAQWRREHSVGIESWEERTIVDLCSMIIDCPHSTPEWSDKGKICLRTTNIKDGYLDLSDVRYVTDDIFDQRNRRAVPQAGDVLLTREGNIGDVGVIPENVEICLGQRMMLLRPNKCQSAFLIYFFRNPKILTDIKAGTMGSTAPRMNIKDIKQLKIHCPNDKEQAEIVRILDDLLAKEQQAKEVAEGVLEQIDLIKKAILARAFRGELGTNDPSEESAVELLKQILSC